MKQKVVILRKTPAFAAFWRLCARSFPRRGIFKGTPLSKCRGFTFPACAFAQGEKAKSVIFAFSRKVHENLGELLPSIFREPEDNASVRRFCGVKEEKGVREFRKRSPVRFKNF